jgi:hypothetical protein
MLNKKTKFKATWGVNIFVGRQKVGEKHFKTEKDLAYYLYKNDQVKD